MRERAQRGKSRRGPSRVVLPALVALVAIGVLLASVSAARNSRSGAKSSHRRHAPIPSAGARLPYGAAVSGTCLTVNRAGTNEMRGWGVYTFDPARIPVIGSSDRRLLPAAFPHSAAPPGLDRFASGSMRPAELTQWQVAGAGRQMPASPAASCRSSIAVASPDAVRSGASVVLRRPGPYIYWTFEHVVHWGKVHDGDEDPAPRTCADDPDQSGRSPAPVGSPPSRGGTNWHWAVDSFCTTVRWWSFDVLGSPGACSEPGYINQYVAGTRLRLPVARGRLGGNACGPSSLLMAMTQSERRTHGSTRLASLEQVFDQTMQRPRDRVTPRTIDDFVGSKAATFLRANGWAQATLGRLGSDADNIAAKTTGAPLDPSNEAQLDRALARGPVVLSTDLGTGRWGTTGDGHMIVVTGRARSNNDEYVVYDPAGNYFADPVNHYGPASCGSAVLYPRSWLLAYATGAWYLELGPRRA
jgi:hypothetical protein